MLKQIFAYRNDIGYQHMEKKQWAEGDPEAGRTYAYLHRRHEADQRNADWVNKFGGLLCLHEKENVYLFRLYNFEAMPRMFTRHGAYEGYCRLVPESYKGFIQVIFLEECNGQTKWR